MLKPRYILIIIILCFVIITFAGFGFEQTFVSRRSQNAYTMVQIAADAALRSATYSDEFFSTGRSDDPEGELYLQALQGINSGDNRGYKIASEAGSGGLLIDENGGDASFTRQNVFVYTYPLAADGSPVQQARNLYERIFLEGEEYSKWAKAILCANVGGDPYMGISVDDNRTSKFCNRSLVWSDQVYDNSNGTETIVVPFGTTKIPKLLTLGAKLYVENGLITEDNLEDIMQSTADTTSEGTDDPALIAHYASDGYFTGHDKDTASARYSILYAQLQTEGKSIAEYVLSTADYWDYVRQSNISYRDQLGNGGWMDLNTANNASGTTYTYFTTPTSLGLTYLDPNVLNVFFRSNMDLLMRAKFLGANGDLSDSYDPFFSDTEGTTYSATYDPAWGDYVVNNGEFYYVRGKPMIDGDVRKYSVDFAGSNNNAIGDDGFALKPKIEYMYFNLNSGVSESNEAIDNILARAISPTVNLQTLRERYVGTESYEFVVAKVTFYADFICPYTMIPMRGMAKNFGALGPGNSLNDEACEASLRAVEINSDVLGSPEILERYLIGRDAAWVDDHTVESSMNGHTQIAYTTYYALAA